MNNQPYSVPTRWWEPRISPLWFRFFRKYRAAILEQQQFTEIRISGLERVRELVASGAGVLITPNHSFHYDSFVVFHVADQVDTPFHIMTAWQVFEMSSRVERWMLQRHGCFSVDREGADRRALKQAIEILRESPHPLVIFPEGDVYHTNDRVRPFREGAAAIALAAAKRAERPIYCLPVALKCRYVSDPTPVLCERMAELEKRIFWRPRADLSLIDRIYRFSAGLMSLKEIEFLGEPQIAPLNTRINRLAEHILSTMETRHGITARVSGFPERVKELRSHHIQELRRDGLPEAERLALCADMDDLFFVMQLYSYPGEYVRAMPTFERLAETIDKLEEDVLDAAVPTVKGPRYVDVRFGEPIPVAKDRGEDDAAAHLTSALERNVQRLLQEIATGTGG